MGIDLTPVLKITRFPACLFFFRSASVHLGTREKYFHARMRKKTAAAVIMNVEINLRTKARNAKKKAGIHSFAKKTRWYISLGSC